jgi:hypothetical protein
VATLYDYIASLKVGSNPVIWADRPLTKAQVDASAGRPYIRVEEIGEQFTEQMYGNVDVIEATVDVFIYQAPQKTSVMPNKDAIMKLYFDLHNAIRHVDAWTYNQPLIAIHRDFGIAPMYDEESGGFQGLLRFRLLFPRG